METTRGLFEPMPGFSHEIGFYLASLEYSRNQWRDRIADLTREELGKKLLPRAECIGTLILHIAEAEYYWIQVVINRKSEETAAKEVADWDIQEDFDFMAKGYDAEYCIGEVEKINQMTRDSLKNFTDSDLEKPHIRIRGESQKEFTLRWVLQHLIDHEATHKGQILMLKRLIREAN